MCIFVVFQILNEKQLYAVFLKLYLMKVLVVPWRFTEKKSKGQR